MTKATFPARLHAVFAVDKPKAVIFRRGPSKCVCTFLWNRDKDTFELGQWLKGRIYERRADLSPDGKYLIYFAMNGKWKSETLGAWTAISKAPWLKAIELYAKGDCWEGGGLFISKNSFWLNDRYADSNQILKKSSEVHRDEAYIPEGGYGGTVNGIRFNAEDTGVYYRRLIRDGWIPINSNEINKHESGVTFEKQLSKGWVLRKIAHEGGPREGKGCYWDEHILINHASGIQTKHSDWEWAELDNKDLVWASRGCLYRSKIKNSNAIEEQSLLYDFNQIKFKSIKAPY